MRLDKIVERAARMTAGKWEARGDAPSTWEGLLVARRDREVLPVYDGGCDLTIYPAPEVNHAFRAWHDAVHVRLNKDFTLEGEVATALEQLRLARVLGATRDQLALLRVDTIGQAVYTARTGRFVEDQRGWVLHRLGAWVRKGYSQ